MNTFIWWTGAIFLSLGAAVGLTEIADLFLTRLLKNLGVWPDVMRAIVAVYREKQKGQHGGDGG